MNNGCVATKIQLGSSSYTINYWIIFAKIQLSALPSRQSQMNRCQTYSRNNNLGQGRQCTSALGGLECLFLGALPKEKIATGVLMAKWDFDTKWTVKPLVVL